MGVRLIWFRNGSDEDFYDEAKEPSDPSAEGSSGLHIKCAVHTDISE